MRRILSWLLPLLITAPVAFIFKDLLRPFDVINSDASNIIQFGSLILFAITSILFGWARAEEDLEFKKSIMLCAVMSLYTSLMLLLSAAFKYSISLKPPSLASEWPFVFKSLYYFASTSGYFGSIATMLGIFFLIGIFMNKYYKGKF